MLFFPRPKSSTINKIIEDQSHKMNFVFPLALINEKEEKLKIEMYKVNEVKSSLDCDVCYQLLVEPVVMACGEIICKKCC